MKYSANRPVFIFVSKLTFFFLFLGCGQETVNHEKSGVAISFDDRFINEWYALRPLFQKYNAKVTFFVTCGDSLSAEEISKLKQLERDGHEIGFHGTIHGKSTELIKALGPEKYAATEIYPGVEAMKKAGFYPKSYAHPGGNHNDQVDSVLFANGFEILRDVAISRRKIYGIPVYTIAPRVMDWIFYGFKKEKLVDALLIDTDSGITEREINDAIEKAKNTGSALMLFGHEPLYGSPNNGEYGFQVAFLEKILKEANRKNLKFYTMSELPEN